MENLHVLILAGGSGTRFWPRSRRRMPKQFLSLAGDRSLIEETLSRVETLCPAENVWVLTRPDLIDSMRRRLPGHPRERIVAEPEGRDTGPCLVWGAAQVE